MSADRPGPTPPPALDELRALAESAARTGGQTARRAFGRPLRVRLKDDLSEVTEIDIAAERAIVAHIRSRRAGDMFLSEEAGRAAPAGDPGAAPAPDRAGTPPAAGAPPRDSSPDPQSPIPGPQSVCWVIDPLDGTRNYVRQLPFFACSVAALWGGAPVAAAVFDPLHDVMYSAAQGAGLSVNGRRTLPAEAGHQVTRAGRPALLVAVPSTLGPAIRHLVQQAVERHVLRNLGSTALHLALVATGQLDAAILGNSRLWDVAAGVLLVVEAGRVATLPDGRPIFPVELASYAGQEIPVLAGSPTAHARLLRESGARGAGGPVSHGFRIDRDPAAGS